MTTENTKTYAVGAMSCGHCESAVAAEVRLVAGVEEIDVDRDTGRIEVAGAGFTDEAVSHAVAKAGDEVVSS